jgi:predicted  nucleic acid-binding Zn ribbon protein
MKDYNPLLDPKPQSTSAVTNLKVGFCPKCKQEMGNGKLANDDTIYFCATCRVASPKPNSK